MDRNDPAPRVSVFAPTPLLTLTIERGPENRHQAHVHPGGQGPWVATMLSILETHSVLCGPFGGETGKVLETLLQRDRTELRGVTTSSGNGCNVEDDMRALITNDDGIDSAGLHTLARVAVEAGLDVVVAAPHEERSGTSASLVATRTDGRLVVEEEPIPGLDGVPSFGVEATPAYITWAGVRGAFGDPPELVLSGVNKGPNTGHAVLHSGTVGAAFTANAHGLPAMAVSVTAADPKHWDTAADVASRTLGWALTQAGLPPVVLNVNVPDVPLDRLRGVRSAPLASFGAVQADIAEIGQGFVTLTFSEIDTSTEPHTDAGLQKAGWATITALSGPSEAAHPPLDGLVDGHSDD